LDYREVEAKEFTELPKVKEVVKRGSKKKRGVVADIGGTLPD
jgi:hypothetical protein